MSTYDMIRTFIYSNIDAKTVGTTQFKHRRFQPEKESSLNGNRTHDVCVARAILRQLSSAAGELTAPHVQHFK